MNLRSFAVETKAINETVSFFLDQILSFSEHKYPLDQKLDHKLRFQVVMSVL